MVLDFPTVIVILNIGFYGLGQSHINKISITAGTRSKVCLVTKVIPSMHATVVKHVGLDNQINNTPHKNSRAVNKSNKKVNLGMVEHD